MSHPHILKGVAEAENRRNWRRGKTERINDGFYLKKPLCSSQNSTERTMSEFLKA